MGERLVRHMACDRCGATWAGEPGDQPSHWIGLKYTTPPLADLNGDSRLILCRDCRNGLRQWLSTPPGQAVGVSP